MHDFQSGSNIDTRPEEEKLKDFTFKEIVASAAAVNWVEKAEPDWKKFPEQQQNGSGSCVAQTIKKLGSVSLYNKEKTYLPFSATDIYQQRSNKPQSGMIGVEAFEIWRKNGITLEQLVPSENMNDQEMDSKVIEAYKREVGRVFKISGHVGIDNGAFETVASVIQQTGKAIMVWFYFSGNDEFGLKIPVVKNPNLSLYGSTTLRHSVPVVDFFLFAGKKYLLIEDSAHFGGITRRLISEEFFVARNWFSRYAMNFTFAPETEPTLKPKYTFLTTLEFGQTSPAIKALQDILKYEGFFATNIASTGYYGAITAKAVLAWQISHNIAPLSELNPLMGRRCGPKTINALNLIYSI